MLEWWLILQRLDIYTVTEALSALQNQEFFAFF